MSEIEILNKIYSQMNTTDQRWMETYLSLTRPDATRAGKTPLRALSAKVLTEYSVVRV